LKSDFYFSESESTRQIKRGAIMSYIAIAVNILAGLLYIPWMVQQIGQDNFGLYTLATSLINMFLIDFGLNEAVSRFVSKYNAEGDQQSVCNMLGITYKIYILIDLLILVVLIIIYFNLGLIYKRLSPSELESLKIVYIIAATFSIFSFPFITLNGILTSYEKFVELKLCDLIHKASSVILIIFALINGYGLYALVTVNAVSGLVIIFIKILIIKRKTPVKVNLKYKSRTMVKNILSFSLWTAIARIAQRFIFEITPSILGAVSGTASISIFGIAASLEGNVYTIASAISDLFLPKVTRIVVKNGASNNLLELMIKVGRIQLSIIGLITIGFISIGKDFILLWMGKDYILSYYSAILLILPTILYLPQQIGNTAIVALNKVKLQAYVFIVMASINIVFSVLFSYLWGVFGASLSIFVSYLIRCIGLNIIYYREMNIDIIKFFKECHIKLMLPLLLVLAIGLGVNYSLPNVNWSTFMLKGILVIITYFIILWVLGFNKYEKDLIKNSMNQFIKK